MNPLVLLLWGSRGPLNFKLPCPMHELQVPDLKAQSPKAPETPAEIENLEDRGTPASSRRTEKQICPNP